MIKAITDFLMTGVYLIVLYTVYFFVAFISTIMIGLPVAVAIHYILEIMKFYII